MLDRARAAGYQRSSPLAQARARRKLDSALPFCRTNMVWIYATVGIHPMKQRSNAATSG